jgi:hypothetical protein
MWKCRQRRVAAIASIRLREPELVRRRLFLFERGFQRVDFVAQYSAD